MSSRQLNVFPLLKLPLFPLKDVINGWNLAKVVELTMISSRLKRRVQSAKYEVDEFRFQYGVYYFCIKIYANPYPHKRGIFEMEALHPSPKDETEFFDRKLNGEVVQASSSVESGKIKVKTDGTHEDRLDMMEKMVIHLQSIIKTRDYKVHFGMKWHPKAIFLWNHIPKIRPLTFDLATSPDTSGDYTWMTFDNISQDHHCEHMGFELPRYPYPVINGMIKSWIDGKCAELEELQFGCMNCREPNSEACLEGITTTPSFYSYEECRFIATDHTQYNHRITPYYLHSPMVDIKRASDGRLATIVYDKGSITMHVWHEKHLEEYRRINELRKTKTKIF